MARFFTDERSLGQRLVKTLEFNPHKCTIDIRSGATISKPTEEASAAATASAASVSSPVGSLRSSSLSDDEEKGEVSMEEDSDDEESSRLETLSIEPRKKRRKLDNIKVVKGDITKIKVKKKRKYVCVSRREREG